MTPWGKVVKSEPDGKKPRPWASKQKELTMTTTTTTRLSLDEPPTDSEPVDEY